MTSLEHLCRCRGLTLGRINPTEDLLLPPDTGQKTRESYVELLDHYALRLLLREVIKSRSNDDWKRGRRSAERFCSSEVVDDYLDQLLTLGVLSMDSEGMPRPHRKVRNFGETYEWYVSRVLERDFGCQAIWGARFESRFSGGDHDVIASLAGKLLYMEVKTSPPKHIEIPEITAFVRRLVDIAPDIAVLHNDTHLRMKDKLVPLLEEAIADVTGRSLSFERLEREIFHLDGSIYIVNSKPDLRRNFNAVFDHFFRTESRVRGALES
ncbi:hypothetical protein EP232_04255 [bacterium]|nr:MAG: hypothetical protein EP232_04255 [bacterium]